MQFLGLFMPLIGPRSTWWNSYSQLEVKFVATINVLIKDYGHVFVVNIECILRVFSIAKP